MSEIDTLVQGTTRALVVGETRTSVKEVIPEVGGTFQLDENVVNDTHAFDPTTSSTKPECSSECKHSPSTGLKGCPGHQLWHSRMDSCVSNHH